MSASNVLLAELSPNTEGSLTSIVATIVGLSLFLARGSIRFLVRCSVYGLWRAQRVAGASEPHSHSRCAMIAEETWE